MLFRSYSREWSRVFHMDQIWREVGSTVVGGGGALRKGKSGKSFKMVWNEGGRGYKPELRKKDTGSFLLCSVVVSEKKGTTFTKTTQGVFCFVQWWFQRRKGRPLQKQLGEFSPLFRFSLVFPK